MQINGFFFEVQRRATQLPQGCLIVTDELAGGLREIFKREWDNRYKTTLGEWKDEPKNGMDFWNRESLRNRKRSAVLWKTIINGNRAEWNCTTLFYAKEHWLNLFHLNSSRSVILNFQESSVWLLIDQEFAQKLIET